MEPKPLSFYTYILNCADGSLYTGWTRELAERVQTHNSGTGAKYTRTRLPVELAAYWEFDNKRDAMRMEYRIKQLPRKQKLQLVAEPSSGFSLIQQAAGN